MSARGTIHPQVRHEENPVTMPGEAEEDAFEADQQPELKEGASSAAVAVAARRGCAARGSGCCGAAD